MREKNHSVHAAENIFIHHKHEILYFRIYAGVWKALPTCGVVSLAQYCLAGSTGHCQAWGPRGGSVRVRARTMRAAGTLAFSEPIIIFSHRATARICMWVGVGDWVREWMSEGRFNGCVEMLPSGPWSKFPAVACPDDNPKCQVGNARLLQNTHQAGLSRAI